MLNFRSIADLNRAIIANLHRIDRDSFDVVVGIPRSGMIPASIIATALQKPLADVAGFAAGIVNGRSGKPVTAGARVLLVDDTVNYGRAMARAREQIGAKASAVTRFTVYGPYREIDDVVDIVCETLPGPRAFEWNYLKHKRLCRWAFDMDGVLCRDPTKAENDDGPQYLRFMAESEPAVIPRRPIGHVITSRIERYRPETESQLRRLGIEFGQLHMMAYASKVERMTECRKENNGRGHWKARIARAVEAELFIESCPKQAAVIAREAGIPVFCVATGELAR